MKKWIFCFLIYSGHASAESFFSHDQVTNISIITANVLLVADWAQTRYIADNPEKFIENGVAENFIGHHPTTGEVNKYFAASIVVINLVGYFVPEEQKKWFYITVSAFEANYVYGNAEIGIRGQF